METCANCGHTIGNLETPRIFNDKIVCGPCEAKLLPPVAPPAYTTQTPQMRHSGGCAICGGELQYKTVSSGNCLGIVVALIVFVVGVAITIAIPVIGWVIGPLLCIGALFMGGKRRKVIRCKSCGAIVAER